MEHTGALRGHAALAVLLGALALTGCQSPESATPASGATASSPAPLTATDGRNYAACADGNCEVLITGPVTLTLGGHGGLDTLVIHRVLDTAIEFDLRGDSEGSGSLSTGCVSTFHANGSGSSCSTGPQPAPEPTRGILAMQLADVREGRAVLRVVAGEPGPPPASLVPRIPTFRPPVPSWPG